VLRTELARPGYRSRHIGLGTNTDPYQPIERHYRITREIIEVLSICRHPLSIVTKSALVERDIDLLAEMAPAGLVEVFVSVTTLDRGLAAPHGAARRGAGAAPHDHRTPECGGDPDGCPVRPGDPGVERRRDGSGARGGGRARRALRGLRPAAPPARGPGAVRGVACLPRALEGRAGS
jgi:hypothetical protein